MKTKDIRILYLYTRFSPKKDYDKFLFGGGAQTKTFEIARYMSSKGASVYIASDDPFDSCATKLFDEVGINFFYLPFNSINICSIIAILLKLYIIIKKNNIHVIHSNHRRTSSIAYFLSFFLKIHIVHTERSLFSDKKFFGFFKIKNITSVSNQTKLNLVKKYNFKPDLITVIHNGIKMPELNVCITDEFKMKCGIDLNKRTIAFIGRLTPEKGLDYLIDALTSVVQTLPGIQVLFVGEEAWDHAGYKQKLIDKADSLNLGNSCIFLGHQKNVAPYIIMSEFTVLPSFFEGLPTVVIESLMLKRPVIATDVGGTKEIIINNCNGILIPPKDINSLSESMLFLLNNRDTSKIMGETGASKICKKFHSLKMYRKYENYYRDLFMTSY